MFFGKSQVPTFLPGSVSTFLPRLRSRPKFASDQTFQTEIISDQNFQTEIHPDQTFQTKWPLIRLSRHRRSLTRIFRPKVFWSDHLQTMVQTQIQTIAQTLIRLWSDSNSLEEVMIRPSCARSSYDQTQLRLQLFMIRLKCAPNRLWSDSSALEIVWSETDFNYEKIS